MTLEKQVQNVILNHTLASFQSHHKMLLVDGLNHLYQFRLNTLLLLLQLKLLNLHLNHPERDLNAMDYMSDEMQMFQSLNPLQIDRKSTRLNSSHVAIS